MSNFVNLHVHSEGSFLDGYSSVDQIARRARELGQPAVALTDHGEVNMHLAFQKACKREGIRGIYGMEGYWSADIQASRDAKTKGLDNSHITLLAKDQKGLANLWAWSSKAYDAENFYLRPQADLALMREYAEGLYASDGCMLTEFARAVDRDDEDKAREILGSLLAIFGDSFHCELHTFRFLDAQSEKELSLNAQMTKLNQAKAKLANEMGIPLIVVNDAHYAWPEDWENHALVWAFNTKQNPDQPLQGQAASWMMGDDELIFHMNQHGIRRSVTEEAIANSFVIANNCNVEISPTLGMPSLAGSEHGDMMMFNDLLSKGFKEKVIDAGLDQELYGTRMEEEAAFITDRNFCGYFNIVSDYVKAAKTGGWKQYVTPGSAKEPMLVGPGRGSAGGSIVSFLLGITTVDPLKYDLLFSRFLSPGRKGLPDIDVDVPQSKRPELKKYLSARFGADHVCGIGTRNRSQARGTLADLCRVKNVPWSDRMAMSKILDEVADIDAGDTDTWDLILSEKGGDLAPWARKHPEVFAKMGQMVGLARHSGTHAAGVVVSAKPIRGNLPTRVKKDQVVTQFDMHEVEELGGVKLDLLGLRHLDTLDVARKLIEDRHGIALDYYSFGDKEMRDPDIWTQIDTGQTVGLFQLETASGTRIAAEFKPRSEIDVAVVSSINRPGVIRAGLLHHYLWRRQGLEEITYDHPLMETIVGETLGILIYQEQLIEAVQALAGFTPIEADDLRKLVGKKEVERLGPMKKKFIDGCLTTGLTYQVATKIWASFEASGSYLFNKSHAVEYAMISTWEVWTRHHYPIEFLVALMQTDSGNINKYVREARKRNIKILPPDINQSDQKFTICPEGIRYGLDSVRGIGSAATEDIIPNRPYADLYDYLERTDGRGGAKKSAVLNLIKIGAFDCFGDRTEIFEDYCDTRPDCADVPIPDFSDEKVVYEIEQELVSNYVTIDPMAKYLNMIEKSCVQHPSEILTVPIGDMVDIGGQVSKLRRHKTKGGKDMAFLALEWNEEEFDITVFPEAWDQCKKLLEIGVPVACRCLRDDRGVHLNHMERLDWLLR